MLSAIHVFETEEVCDKAFAEVSEKWAFSQVEKTMSEIGSIFNKDDDCG